MTAQEIKTTNFIKNIIDDDLAKNTYDGRVHTRFPPEPNGYLHIGHAKSICLNFGLAKEYGGKCNLRFDDTNPETENVEYMESIKDSVKWLGFDWDERLFHASDYFDQLYDYVIQLIKIGKAFVCSLSAEQIREHRGTLTDPGKPSPYRNRSVEENLSLFERMRAGEFKDGEHVLRAKIDWQSSNVNMRDPVIYRIKHMTHHMTGNKWCIYPMYDYTHCISDALEFITHSLCTLEFQDHRPLYDWCLEVLNTPGRPKQIEFSRLNINYTVTSKRKLKQLVEDKYVNGWDDPRMPTIVGLRRRGVPPKALHLLSEKVGISKSESITDISILEESIREVLNETAHRRMCILRPIKVVIENYSAEKIENLTVPNHPQNPSAGSRSLHFSKTLYIEADDFMENPPKDFFRLRPGGEVRLRYGYIIKCEQVIKNDAGEVTELRCSYDDKTLGQNPVGRKVKGVIHWLSEKDATRAAIRLYDRLFLVANPASEDDFTAHLNPDSLKLLTNCYVEKSLAAAKAEEAFQFERQGYFCVDSKESKPTTLVFNRTVTLKDTWAKPNS